MLEADYDAITSDMLTQIQFIQSIRSALVLLLNISDAAITSIQLMRGSIVVVVGFQNTTDSDATNSAVSADTLHVTFQGKAYPAQAVVR